MRFREKIVVVTGASSGIGAAVARAFVQEGARVVLVARGVELLNSVCASMGTAALAFPADVSRLEDLEALIQFVQAEFGALHYLVQSAGGNPRGPACDQDARALAMAVDVNLRAPIVLTRLALPLILDSGGGGVVNVASLAGKVPLEDEATYSATKFGLRAFSLAMGQELRETAVTVSVVSPGPVDTGFIMGAVETVPDLVFSQPVSTAEEVAARVLECAYDGKPERALPAMGSRLATLAYLFPGLGRLLKPHLRKRGARAKAHYLAREKARGA